MQILLSGCQDPGGLLDRPMVKRSGLGHLGPMEGNDDTKLTLATHPGHGAVGRIQARRRRVGLRQAGRRPPPAFSLIGFLDLDVATGSSHHQPCGNKCELRCAHQGGRNGHEQDDRSLV